MSTHTHRTTIGLDGGSYIVVPQSVHEVVERLGLTSYSTPAAGFFEFTQVNGFPAFIQCFAVVSVTGSDPDARPNAKPVFLVGGHLNVEQGDGRTRRDRETA